MSESVKKVLRSVQTLFPYLHELRFALVLSMIKMTKIPHERDFRAIKLFQPPADRVFVDVGSNRGEAIASMQAVSKGENKIIGFEPNPLIFKRLKEQFKRNSHVTVHNFGLGNQDEELTLFVPFYRKWMFDGLGSFKYEAAKDWLTNRLWLFNERKLTIRKLNCRIRKLDDFQLKPYFIKIDVQGYELEVLKGGSDTIAAHHPILLIESISPEVENFLKRFDYQFYNFSGEELVKGRGILNTFCMTPERYSELSHKTDHQDIPKETEVLKPEQLSRKTG